MLPLRRAPWGRPGLEARKGTLLLHLLLRPGSPGSTWSRVLPGCPAVRRSVNLGRCRPLSCRL